MDYRSTIDFLSQKGSPSATILPILLTNAYRVLPNFNEMLAFYSDTSNDLYTTYAIKNYGVPIATNTSGQTTQMLTFWYYCKYAKFFNLPNLNLNDQTSCFKFNSILQAIASEEASLAAMNGIQTSQTNNSSSLGSSILTGGLLGAVINSTKGSSVVTQISPNDYSAANYALKSIKNTINGAYSNLTCDLYISNYNQQNNLSLQAQAQGISQQGLLDTASKVVSSNGGGLNIALYASIGVGIIVLILIIAKTKKNNNN